MTLLIISISLTPVLASNTVDSSSSVLRSSLYIAFYDAQITTGPSGKIMVDCSITGTNIMDTIGETTLVIQKYQSGSWVNMTTWSNLYSYNSASSAATVSYYGTVGAQYRAVITFYAALNGGSDSRIMTTRSVTAIK